MNKITPQYTVFNFIKIPLSLVISFLGISLISLLFFKEFSEMLFKITGVLAFLWVCATSISQQKKTHFEFSADSLQCKKGNILAWFLPYKRISRIELFSLQHGQKVIKKKLYEIQFHCHDGDSYREPGLLFNEKEIEDIKKNLISHECKLD